MAIDLICNRCGGNNVSRDAWANRDAADQEWEFGAVFDYAHCHDCDGETPLVEVDLVPASRPTSRAAGTPAILRARDCA